MENENYEAIGIVPQEIRLRDVLGVSMDKEQIAEKFASTCAELLGGALSAEGLKEERERYFYNLGSGGTEGAKYIIRYLINKKKS